MDNSTIVVIVLLAVDTILLILLLLLLARRLPGRDAIVWRGVSKGEIISEKASNAAVQCQQPGESAEEPSLDDQLPSKKAFD